MSAELKSCDPDYADRIVSLFDETAWRSIGKLRPLNCCIGATWVTLRVMEEFGVEAVPCPVMFRIYNVAYRRLKGFEHDDAPVPAAAPGEAEPCVFLGGRHRKNSDGGWNGHLVANVAGRIMIDASLKQAHRPQQGFEIEDGILIATIPEEFFTSDSATIAGVLPNGALLVYWSDAANLGYLDGEDWTDNEHLQPLVANIVADMKGVMRRRLIKGE